MKPHLVLVGLGHGQLEILDRLDELKERYEVSYIGGETTIYTGAFPQVLARETKTATVYLRPGVERVATRLVSLDPVKRIVNTDVGPIPYDTLVLATGAESRGIGFGVKPMTETGLKRILSSRSITVVGGGKAGVELAFACIRTKRHVTLYADEVLPGLPVHIQRHMMRRLVKSGVTLVSQKYEGEPFHDGLVLDAAGVRPVDWWTRAGLAPSGHFIETDRYLRHVVHKEIFITGDMASRLDGGVDAVRSGRHVAAYLLGDRKPFESRTSLNILLTVPRHALLTFGTLAWHGRIPYYVKRWIDSRYMKRFRA
ncbi:NAD(P)/FAD-dependent oxidoreductase [Exiguobacterium sp.]|uniref:NAD(P)/FAD-dependent oxidoreductase n=1 Tax=Exiguobacterium sp. TaxID=44751 RepID=UPI00391BA849